MQNYTRHERRKQKRNRTTGKAEDPAGTDGNADRQQVHHERVPAEPGVHHGDDLEQHLPAAALLEEGTGAERDGHGGGGGDEHRPELAAPGRRLGVLLAADRERGHRGAHAEGPHQPELHLGLPGPVRLRGAARARLAQEHLPPALGQAGPAPPHDPQGHHRLLLHHDLGAQHLQRRERAARHPVLDHLGLRRAAARRTQTVFQQRDRAAAQGAQLQPVPRAAAPLLHAVPVQRPAPLDQPHPRFAAVLAVRQQSEGDQLRVRTAGGPGGQRQLQARAHDQTALPADREVHFGFAPAGRGPRDVFLRERVFPLAAEAVQGDDLPHASARDQRAGGQALAQCVAGESGGPQEHFV